MFGPPTIYIVEPTQELLSMEIPSQTIRSCVSETKVWQNNEGASDLLPDNRCTIAKYLFLSYFLSFREFDALLGFPQVSEATFDKYWSLRRLCVDGSFHHLNERSKRMEKNRISSTGHVQLDQIVMKTIDGNDR